MSATMRIVNGQVYDPKNNINGEIKEICIQDGKIVDAVDDDATIIDAKGMVIMPAVLIFTVILRDQRST